jgi:hypothetical protein
MPLAAQQELANATTVRESVVTVSLWLKVHGGISGEGPFDLVATQNSQQILTKNKYRGM